MQSAVARIELELGPGERILWAGQPKAGWRLASADFFLIPFSLVWLAFSVFWTVMALRITRGAGVPALDLLFPLFGVPFILVGLYLTVGRFWFDARRRSRTYYAITSHRVLALLPAKSGALRSLDLRNLDDFTVREGRDGIGTIAFSPSNIRTFEQIPNFREVESILRNAHAQRRKHSPGPAV